MRVCVCVSDDKWPNIISESRSQSDHSSVHSVETADLSIEPRRHGHDVPRLAVDGEHVGDGAVRHLGEDSVAHHPVGRGVVVAVERRHVHHVGSWWGKASLSARCVPAGQEQTRGDF